MIWGLGLLAAVWFGGKALGWSEARRMVLMAGLWAALVLLHLALPGAGRFFGGSAAGWAVLGAVMGLVLAYRAALRRLRQRAGGASLAEEKKEKAMFSKAELDRYARHILLREIGGPGQARLKAARVLVVGAGGLGSPVLLYLAAAGVGTLGVVDDDVVEASNLQRQIIHTGERVGQAKVTSAGVAVAALNPFVDFRGHEERLTEANAAALIGQYDLVLDGTDNFDTRYLVNRTCVALGKPLLAGAITQWEGQLSLYDPARGGPCYECIFPERPLPGMVPTCAEAGVAAPLPGIIGAMMAMEAVKLITGAGEDLLGRLLIHDALYAETRTIGVKARADCPVCGKDHSR